MLSICIVAAALVELQQYMNAIPWPAAEVLCMVVWQS